MRRLLPVIVLVWFTAWLGACSWAPHQRDPATIASVAQTQKNSAADAARASSALDRAAEVVTGTATPDQRLEEASALRKEAANIRALEAAEQSRLGSWKWREEQKSE